MFMLSSHPCLNLMCNVTTLHFKVLVSLIITAQQCYIFKYLQLSVISLPPYELPLSCTSN